MGFFDNLFSTPVNTRVVVARHLRVADDALGEVLSRFRLKSSDGLRSADADEITAYNSLIEARRIVREHLVKVEALHTKYDDPRGG